MIYYIVSVYAYRQKGRRWQVGKTVETRVRVVPFVGVAHGLLHGNTAARTARGAACDRRYVARDTARVYTGVQSGGQFESFFDEQPQFVLKLLHTVTQTTYFLLFLL